MLPARVRDLAQSGTDRQTTRSAAGLPCFVVILALLGPLSDALAQVQDSVKAYPSLHSSGLFFPRYMAPQASLLFRSSSPDIQLHLPGYSRHHLLKHQAPTLGHNFSLDVWPEFKGRSRLANRILYNTEQKIRFFNYPATQSAQPHPGQ